MLHLSPRKAYIKNGQKLESFSIQPENPGKLKIPIGLPFVHAQYMRDWQNISNFLGDFFLLKIEDQIKFCVNIIKMFLIWLTTSSFLGNLEDSLMKFII